MGYALSHQVAPYLRVAQTPPGEQTGCSSLRVQRPHHDPAVGQATSQEEQAARPTWPLVGLSPGWPPGLGSSVKEAGPGPSGQAMTPTSWCGHGRTLYLTGLCSEGLCTHQPRPTMKLIDASNAHVLQAKCVPGTVLGAGDPTTGLLFSQPPHMWVQPTVSGWYVL